MITETQLLYFIIFGLVSIIAMMQFDTITSGILGKLLEAAPKLVPFLFGWYPKFTQWWLCKWYKYVLIKQIRASTDSTFDAAVHIEFVQAEKVKTEHQGKKILVMYNPTENSEKNISNLVLAVAENYVPNGKKIMSPDLQKCVKFAFAQDIVEDQGGTLKVREFAADHLLKGKRNLLTSNRYYSELAPIKEKKLLSRLYMHSLVSFAHNFNVSVSSPDLQATCDRFTSKISMLASSFMDGEMPAMMKSGDAGYERDFEYFFRENGLSVNLMFIRSMLHFSKADTKPYVEKARELVRKGVQVNYVIAGGFSLKDLPRKDYLARIEFAKKVTSEIKKNVPELKLISSSEKTFVRAHQQFPIHIAVFVREQ